MPSYIIRQRTRILNVYRTKEKKKLLHIIQFIVLNNPNTFYTWDYYNARLIISHQSNELKIVVTHIVL